jgi:hypothetical protein
MGRNWGREMVASKVSGTGSGGGQGAGRARR